VEKRDSINSFGLNETSKRESRDMTRIEEKKCLRGNRLQKTKERRTTPSI